MNWRATWKAHVAAILGGLGAFGTAALTGEPVDAEAAQGLAIGLTEVAGSLITAAIAWAGVYLKAND